MSKLASLRTGLTRLRRRRQMVRWGIALVVLLLAAFSALVLVFVIDWFFDMTRLQRIILLLASVAGLYWAYRRFAWPWLAIQESEIDVALLVARQHEMDCDLVAALQFEGSGAEQWGSTPLREAVIDYVADFGKGLNVFQGFSVRGLVWRVVVLGVVVLVIGLFSVAHGNYLSAFLNRICLGSVHYPTRTVLDQVTVNGEVVDPSAKGTVVRSPYSTLVNLSVLASGDLPAEGKVVVKPCNGRSSSTVKLARDDAGAKYEVHLPEIVDALDLEVFLGDAHTESIRIEVIPLPVLSIQAVVTVPDYAQGTAGAASTTQNTRQITVIEGSRIDLQVVCSNKRLTSALLTLEGKHYPLMPVSKDDTGQLWTLADTDSPLKAVAQPLRYEVQVIDEDGLSLPKPFEGSVRIKPDQMPQIAGRALTRFVLPNARPPVHFRATDDFGIAKLLAHVDVKRKDGQAEPRRTVPMRELAKPLLRDQLPMKGTFPLDLASLGLKKGDQVSVTLAAVDYRGGSNGQSGSSEPILFEITDEAGILEDLARPDYQSAEELDAIIRQQLNIGGVK